MSIITIDEAATKLATDKEYDAKYYSVIVNTGYGYPVPNNPMPNISTPKEQITLSKCANICKNLKNQFPDSTITKIKILMYEWDYSDITPEHYINIIYGDCGLPFNSKKSKTAVYWPAENRLLISDVCGYPIYENYDGRICNDPDALADSLLD